MPLPTDPNAPWPPTDWQPIARSIDEAAAWYAGDEGDLAAFYGRQTSDTRRPSEMARTRTDGGRFARVRFWARREADQHTDRQRLHVPAAADIAATSADLLFGAEPRLTIPAAHTDDQGGDQTAAAATEDRLVELADLDGWAATLLEAAEVAAGLSGVYLRAAWDEEVADHPMLSIVHADHAVPEFAWGRLRAVTFWRTVRTDGAGAVWRHLERHEAGVILHGLYIGKADKLGQQVQLDRIPETAGLDDEVRLPGSLAERLDVAWVPNVLPNRKWRDRPVGRSDTAGCEGLMDALDETWTSWMRDVRLAKARIIVPDDFLDRRGRGQGATFDTDREVFSPLNVDPSAHDKAGITLSQFAIRTEDHAKTCAELFERIVVTGGYSPSTFGLIGDTAIVQTATEVVSREARTANTIGRKQRYWQRAIEGIGEVLLIIDREIFGSDVEPMRPQVVWPDRDEDPRRVAETVDLLARARAASVETRVRMAQPDLEGDALQAEVQRILAEEGLSVLDPTGGAPIGGGQPPEGGNDGGGAG